MHVMLDLETMGTGSTAVVWAIGAVKFNPHDINSVDYDGAFLSRIDLDSSLRAGMKVDGGTLEWWMQTENDKARSELMAIPADTHTAALLRFQEWLGDLDGGMWGNGATFDNVILRNAYKAIGRDAPWSHRADRCYRTVKNLDPYVPPVKYGTLHNPVSDAISQALHLIEITRKLGLVLA